jgi:GNAT superfamily N-acetyltransferase
VRELPIAWATDLAVLEYAGSSVDDRSDHLIVRTPHNPTFHWGNCVLVTNAGVVDDAERWIRVFDQSFPTASWKSIGLPAMPRVHSAWTDRGVGLEVDDVLSTRVLPLETPLAASYSVRRLEADDWEQVVGLALAENERTGEWPPASHERFVRARSRSDRAVSERNLAAFFGAFAGETLVASLGIVLCGTTARYQNVGTDAPHRRRGLASHLLGVAARWAADRRCDRWVIVTESTNPAGRVYRSVGFEIDTPTVQAYRRPASHSGNG